MDYHVWSVLYCSSGRITHACVTSITSTLVWLKSGQWSKRFDQKIINCAIKQWHLRLGSRIREGGYYDYKHQLGSLEDEIIAEKKSQNG